MRDALERETSGSIFDPSKSIDRNRTRHRQHDGDQHCAPPNSLSNPNPGLRQRNDFRAEDKVNSSAQAKNNGVHDKPVLVSAGWLDLFATLFTRGSLQLFANFGALADFLHCVAHHDWNRTVSINRPPRRAEPVPAIRQDFISLAEARRLLAARPGWRSKIRGDLQMHTRSSDGSGTVAEMADAAVNRSYEYIAITDHSKTLKIAGGI